MTERTLYIPSWMRHRQTDLQAILGNDVEVEIVEDTNENAGYLTAFSEVRSQSLTETVATLLAPVLVAAVVAVSFLLGWHARPDGPARAIIVEVEATTTTAAP